MNLNILIVEDEIEFLHYLCTVIPWSRYGLEVTDTASDVDSALAVIRDKRIDLVLLDITLRKSNGLTLAEKLQNIPGKPGIIVITGHSEFDIVQKALRLGIEDYLLKPFAKQELLMSLLSVKEKLTGGSVSSDNPEQSVTAKTEERLHHLTLTESEEERDFICACLKRTGIELPETPRVLISCTLTTRTVSQKILSRWIHDVSAMWKAAVENWKGLVWTCQDNIICILLHGQEASELEWDCLDLAREFISQIDRHLPYSVIAGISQIEKETPSPGSLKTMADQAFQSLMKGRAGHPVSVFEHETQPSPEPGSLNRYLRARKFIDKYHHDFTLDVQTVASHLDISTEYLRQIFQKNTEKSCIQNIIERRMEHAFILLEIEGLTIREIAARSGFRDASYFTRQFKLHTGMTPRQYRQKTGDKRVL